MLTVSRVEPYMKIKSNFYYEHKVCITKTEPLAFGCGKKLI